MVSAQPHVLVVGGGLAGLAAACQFARGGWSVTVVERRSALGGRARSSRHDGFVTNLGPHALYTGGAMTAALDQLDVSYGAAHGPRGVKTYRDGRFHAMPDSFTNLLSSRGIGWRDKVELASLMSTLPHIRAADWSDRSVAEWIPAHVHRKRVRSLVEALARTGTYCANLDVVSADVFLDKTQRSLQHPVHYVDGGWQTIVDGLRQRAQELGVELRTGARITTLTTSADLARAAVSADGTEWVADCLVIATTPHDAARLAPDYLTPLTQPLVPVKVACLDLALQHLPRRATAVVQDLQSPRFLSAQSVFARLAPIGTATLTAFKQLDPLAPPDPARDEEDLEEFVDLAQPGWRQELVHRRFLPSMTAAGALPTAASRGLAGRPTVNVPGLANVFLAGDWVGEVGFLADACFASARAAFDQAELLRGHQQPVGT